MDGGGDELTGGVSGGVPGVLGYIMEPTGAASAPETFTAGVPPVISTPAAVAAAVAAAWLCITIPAPAPPTPSITWLIACWCLISGWWCGYSCSQPGGVSR